jgi:hypothetical protein
MQRTIDEQAASITDLIDRCVQPDTKNMFVVNVYMLELPQEIDKIRFIRCMRKNLITEERRYILDTDYKLVATFDERANSTSSVRVIKDWIKSKGVNVPVKSDQGYGPEKATIGFPESFYPKFMKHIQKCMIKK